MAYYACSSWVLFSILSVYIILIFLQNPLSYLIHHSATPVLLLMIHSSGGTFLNREQSLNFVSPLFAALSLDSLPQYGAVQSMTLLEKA